GELADRGLVFEDRLEDALAQLGLVRRVRGQELAALQDRVHDRRHVVVVEAGAQERDRRAVVLRRKLLEVRAQLLLAQGRRELELTVEPDARGQVGEELLDVGDADLLQHRLAIGVCQREVRHACSSRCRRYASTSSSASASEGSERRTRTSHPSPYGSSFTVSGASTIARLTSTTSPESGAITSETAFTDSTSA